MGEFFHAVRVFFDQLAGLLVDTGVNLDHAAVGLRRRGAHLEHLRLAIERVAMEDRVGVAELLGGEVRDRLARDVAHGHPDGERVDERADDDVSPLL